MTALAPMKSSPAAEARISAGQKTRQVILDHAVDLASVEGLEGLTIGRLADELGMSKSGLFAHFGSKEDLQLAAVESARERFVAEVFQPALQAGRGVPRILAICEAWLAYIRRGVFPDLDVDLFVVHQHDDRLHPLYERVGSHDAAPCTIRRNGRHSDRSRRKRHRELLFNLAEHQRDLRQQPESARHRHARSLGTRHSRRRILPAIHAPRIERRPLPVAAHLHAGWLRSDSKTAASLDL